MWPLWHGVAVQEKCSGGTIVQITFTEIEVTIMNQNKMQ